ncbi:hypothetical protein DSO57_1024156 [Entomophthora muscae]|uniref:Uncharacterized protein n=2 Tax=Entomophthora muscae TaxID=34485 RepID=A0ACC2UNI8_9FUNG|nr:hypothetical protein DSO57_1024154 [Entomophthora muscae]KAJ9088334.1 hypothetical protein DSO57_1024156 [Entomophthora muscae]
MHPKYYPGNFGMPFFYVEDPRRRDAPNETSAESSQPRGSFPRHQNSKNAMVSSEAAHPKDSSNAKWPPVDILEYNDKYLVEVEIPGFQKKDISIDFEDNSRTLTIKGAWTAPQGNSIDKSMLVTCEDEDDDIAKESVTSSLSLSSNMATRVLKERRVERNFKRSFLIKERISAAKINASLNDGVLLITIPKSAEEKKHHISIL